MRNSFVAETGLRLARSPSARQQATRRRLAIVGGLAALALASTAVGMLTPHHRNVAATVVTGPFSYFPS
jgi:hypothetical protein